MLKPDAFDADAVEMMRRMGTKKGVAPTHYYPLAMATYDMMPPPEKVEVGLGEKRLVFFTGAGLSIGPEVDVSGGKWAAGVPEAESAAALAKHLYDLVCAEYDLVQGCTGTGAPFPLPPDSARPWLGANA